MIAVRDQACASVSKSQEPESLKVGTQVSRND